MSSQQLQTIIQFLRANPTPPGIPAVQQRQAMDNLAGQSPLPDTVYQEEITAVTVPCRIIAAENADDTYLIIYLHGGGYATGSSLSHRDLGWRLSAAAQSRVIMPDYRLAPENRFPAAVEDAVMVYQWLLDNGFAPERLAFAGDSAGGGLAAAALLKLRDEGVVLPATAVFISPWFDLTLTSATISSKKEDDVVLSPARLQEFADWYLGDTPADTPLASPLYADLHDLPPLLIQVGTNEILLDDARQFAAKAEAAGVMVTLEVEDGLIHVWPAFADFLPEGQEAIAQAGAFLLSQWGRT